MGRHTSSGSYGQRIYWHNGWYISWCVDYYYAGCRTRFPRVFRRYTTEAGVCRFAKKWAIPLPEDRCHRPHDGRGRDQ